MSYDPAKAVRYMRMRMAGQQSQSREGLFQAVRSAIIDAGVPAAAAPLGACILDIDYWKLWFKKKGVPVVHSAAMAQPGDIAILDFRVIMVTTRGATSVSGIDWTGETVTIQPGAAIALMSRGNNFG